MDLRKSTQSHRALYLFMGLTLLFIIWLGSLSTRYPDGAQERMVPLEIASNSETYNSILSDWLGDPPDPGGLRALKSSFWIDFGFIIAYGLLLISSLGITQGGAAAWTIGIPTLVAGFDVLENTFHLLLLDTVSAGEPLPDFYSQTMLTLAATASHAKWILFVGATAALLVLYVKNFREIDLGPKIGVGVVLLGLLAFSGVYIQAVIV
jgi:hypothetical protein